MPIDRDPDASRATRAGRGRHPGTTVTGIEGPAPAALAGLSSEEATHLLRQHGPNTTPEERVSTLRLLLGKLWAPVPWMLELTIVLELVLGKTLEAVVVAALLLFNALVSWVQENRAQEALSLLRKRLSVVARVLRDGTWRRLPAQELVPGDVVHLRVGDVVPADVALDDGLLEVDQSALTGESLPVEAGGGHAVYAGSTVTRGEATGTVTATAAGTYFGHTAELVRTARTASHLEAVVTRIVRALVTLDLALAVVVVGIGLAGRGTLTDMLSFGVVLLLASVPVALPATFALAGALGAHELAEHGVLTTRLSAIEEAASMDVACTDKTGTITLNQLALAATVAYPPEAEARVLALACQASDAATQDPIDMAILAGAVQARVDLSGTRRLAFTPFAPETKLSEAQVATAQGTLRVVKGAPQVVAALCANPPAALEDDLESLAARGLRVLAVAVGETDRLRLAGLVGLQDPPRPESRAVVASLEALGLRVIMITGDTLPTARAMASEVGLEGSACTAAEIRERALPPTCAVLADVLPEDKFNLVRRLQEQGHVVGMTGDGVNDAPALKQAEVGIAVANATDVARAAASIVLTQPGLGDVVTAIELSRRIYQRMLTYALNSSIKKLEVPVFLSLVFLATGRVALTPLLMVLLLFANDFATMAITTDRSSSSRRPNRWAVQPLLLGALGVALPSLVLTLAVFWAGSAMLALDTARLQTLAFVTLAVGSQATVYLVREPRRFWSSRPGPWLVAASAGAVLAVAVLASAGWLMAPLSPALVAAVCAAVGLLAVLVDWFKVRLFGRLGLHAV
jgi:H+-transporting ATPase